MNTHSALNKHEYVCRRSNKQTNWEFQMQSAIMHMHIITTYGVRTTNKILVRLGHSSQTKSLVFTLTGSEQNPQTFPFFFFFLQYGAKAYGFSSVASALSCQKAHTCSRAEAALKDGWWRLFSYSMTFSASSYFLAPSAALLIIGICIAPAIVMWCLPLQTTSLNFPITFWGSTVHIQ